MKLVKQKTLYFRNEKSDKVYEVDLCEAGEDLFVVNFRYGKRNANLKEGTKTVFPVEYNEAEKIFDKLIASKEKKGYSESGIPIQQEEKVPQVHKQQIYTIREETIRKYLIEATLGTYQRNWRVSRIILRAGALNMHKETALIAQFIDSKDEFEQYAAISVLNKFNNTSALDSIYKVFTQKGFDNKVGRLAAAYSLKNGDITPKADIKFQVIQKMPKDIQLEDPHLFISSLSTYFLGNRQINAATLYYAYIFSYEKDNYRKLLYDLLEKIPLKLGTFKSIRYIYRAAEMLNDFDFLALISKRIALSKPGYTSDYFYINGNWTNADEEKKKPNPVIAFSGKTKNYFNKATYRYVYKLSQNKPDDYIAFATPLLSILDDELDQQHEHKQGFYNWNATNDNPWEIQTFPAYHHFSAVMYILFGGSTRSFSTSKNKLYFIEEENEQIPREEALPELWNTKPKEVLHILGHSKSTIVTTFALKIIEENTHFLDSISDDILTKLVNHKDERVLDLILEVLEKKYSNSKPEENILLALLQSFHEKAVQRAMEWLKKYEVAYLSNPEFLADLLFTEQNLVIQNLKEVYANDVKFKHELDISVLQPFFEIPKKYTEDYLLSVNELIGESHFGELFKTSKEKIEALANSNSTINKLFAANLSKHNTLPAYELLGSSLNQYIDSEEDVLRKVGIELLSHFPDEYLLENQIQIAAYCFAEHSEVREAIQPSIERLIKLDPKFKDRLLQQLLNAIIEVEQYEGIHKNSYAVLTQYYEKNLPTITEDGIIGLILSKYEFAQKLGMPLFKEIIQWKNFSMEELVGLSHCDILEVREMLQDYFTQNIAQVNYELEDALRIFNTNWQDIIDWSFKFFEENIEEKHWTVDMLLYVSDHTKKDVQAFGRKMITKHFSEEKGLPLLLKLQEHPTKDMQFFVTNYLNNYAKDNPEVILKLEQYFKTSLFNINTHRATKTRIYSFLEQESLKNEDVAKMTIRIIESILGTKTIKDIDHNIDILLSIKEMYPNIEVPLSIKTSIL